MKPFRKNVALSIDGGGIRGTIVAKALAVLEEELGQSWNEMCGLTAGTSTGSIIAAGIGLNISGERMHELYCQLGETIFPKNWRSKLWPFTGYRYTNKPLIEALRSVMKERKMGDLWQEGAEHDVVIVLRDLVENRQRFVKPWKESYKDWLIWESVLSSCTVPTYFKPVQGRYIDGGVGSYSNPCYIAAYEIAFCLEDWDPAETTLISLGTGSGPHKPRQPQDHMFAWEWIGPLVDAFTADAARQQVHLVNQFFQELDFRRFQVKMEKSVPMDGVDQIPVLSQYGEKLAQMILNDEWEPPQPLADTITLGQ